MKRLISLLLTVLLTVTMLTVLPAAAADDFEIEDGVLVRYRGSAASVTVPDGVYAVGDGAFEGNTAVKTVVLPSSVRTVGNRAFYQCSSLTRVTGSAVGTVGVLAFNGTPYFDQSTAEFFTLGSCLLWYNGSASRVTLPSGITSVAPFAFLRYEGLTAFSAPSGLVSVGEGAFFECKSLSSVSLPASVTYIGAAAFDGTALLNKASGFVILGDGILIRYAGSDTQVKIPDGVRRIAAGAFSANKTITSLTLCDTVYSVDGGACEGCTKLKNLTLNRGLVYIGERAFADCSAIDALNTPNTLAYIAEGAFENSGVTGLQLRGSKLIVGANAFRGCGRLKWMLLSDGVYALGDGAFSGCKALSGASIAPATIVIASDSFEGCGGLTVYCSDRAFAASPLFGYAVSCSKGDVDMDGSVSILDATRIQRHLVGIVTYSVRETCVSDVDYDGEISIMDVTHIQRVLAGLA